MEFKELAYKSADEMIFGKSLHPVKCGFGIEIGNGAVYPEINYTLPAIGMKNDNNKEILKQYEDIVSDILSRAHILQTPGIVLEFEHPPQLTMNVEMGAQVTKLTLDLMEKFYCEKGLNSALRVTVCDIRDQERPPKIRTENYVKTLFDSFIKNAESGAHMLSIESIGGKEVTDIAIIEADIPGLLFGIGILSSKDMHFLWENIVKIAKDKGSIPAGDTACGIANTAMVLADRGFIPVTLAAVIRAMTAPRSLIAYEEGAIGPSKDCAYEGPVIKAITGFPISMEGKSSACAHFSHMGNIAAATCDLWSNESVQNVRLLSGFAPEVFTEILIYDCRLMNAALKKGHEVTLKNLFIKSDENLSPHAFIISPEASYEIAKAIISEKDDFKRTHLAGLTACELLNTAIESGYLKVPEREKAWLGRIWKKLEEYDEKEKVIDAAMSRYKDKVCIEEYEL